MPTADELIVQTLEEAGIEYVIGIPGGGTGQIFNLLYGKEDRIKTILVRHEQIAAIMADAYGRATGRPAAIMGQGLFMASNATFGIMEAMLSSSPMLVITDTSDGGVAFHAANQSGAGEYGSMDITTILKTMTKYTSLATTPKEAVMATQLAIKHATSGRPGPASVVMRSAAISGEVDVESPPFIHNAAGYLNTAKPQSAPQDIQKAIEILSQSKRPVLVAGNGVHLSKSHQQLQELAELWNMPVATSYKGKSAIAETHPLSVGMVGVYGQEAANRSVGEADTVVVVGAKLTPQDTVRERPSIFNPLNQKIIQIDIDDRNAGWTFPVDLGLIGDAGSILSQLVEASQPVAANSASDRKEWADALPQRKQDGSFYEDPAMHQDSSPVTPQRLVALLHENMSADAIFALDAGNNRTWMAHFYQARQANTFFSPGGTAGMGWGLPAAVGLKLVYKDRPVVCVTGDGGYMMTVNALSTAVQYDLPIICVVFNDGALGMVRQHQPEGRRIASEFVTTDNGAVARGFGAFGIQVGDSRDLPDAIRQAQASGLPAVIDVLIDRGPSPDDWRADARRAGET
ncbi:MAG TPA: acetolactate synthase [Dehalococcoidia bacterium]|uniref:Acetolactate synthase n=1 Tax=marine metagenome TaxID=408172 RepID=A0A382CSI8_9ZZZZ|nr:acetolactate synthase [Dehalococcoidia bacterium]HAI99593.1 acetolactate synthase [Dehalococcoidia bacterium]|tara:strand:+ start:3246 stop:4964 length:1719 start_codon:yes stop_codon:yes gene_type:complete